MSDAVVRRRWIGGVLASCLGLGGVATACSSFASDPTPAAVPGDDASTTGDAPGPEPDGAVAADAGWTPCSARPLDPAHFCDDFDDLGLVDGKWKRDLRDGGTLSETTEAVSAPRAIVLGVAAGSGTEAALIRRSRDPNVDVSQKSVMRLAFSMRVTQAPNATSPSAFTQFGGLVFDDPPCFTSGTNKQRQLEMSFDGQGRLYFRAKGLQEKCGTDAGSDYVDVPTGLTPADFHDAYRRIAITIARTDCNGGATGSSLHVAIEGAAPLACAPLDGGDPFAHASTLDLVLGLYSYTSSGTVGETRFAYDNITFDLD